MAGHRLADRRRIGLVSAALTPVLAVLTWASSGDVFPPSISISQYGIGRWGWLFSCWAVSFGIAGLLLCQVSRPKVRPAIGCAWAGLAGTVVMALVRTDRGGAQQSLHARVHMVGAIIALVGLPIATWLTVRLLGGWWRVVADGLLVISAGSLVLLVAAAFGWDSLALGQARTWAFWQVVATVADQVLLGVLAVAAGRARTRSVTGGP